MGFELTENKVKDYLKDYLTANNLIATVNSLL